MKSIEEITIGNLFKKNVRAFPDKTVQVFEDGRRQTYKELNERTNRLANGLLDLGLKKGDHVAILACNCLEYMEFSLATAKVGIVSVLINYLMPKERIAYTLDHSDSKAVLFESRFMEVVEYTKSEAKKLEYFIMMKREGVEAKEGIIDYETLLERSSNEKLDIEIKITDANTLLYTTGTTGAPKGVLKSMAADMSISIAGMVDFPHYSANPKLGLRPYNQIVTLVIPPQFHLGGYALTLQPFIFPTTTVLANSFEPKRFLKFIHEEKVTTTWVQPAMLYQIKRLPEEIIKKYDVSSVIRIMCGSTALKAQERKEMLSFFPNAKLSSSYAATEFGSASLVSQEELEMTRPDSLGMPSYNTDLKIADEDGQELAVGKIGLIWATGPGLPIGCEYYKDEEKTEKSFKNGWVAVGDLGWKDEEGYFYFYGRADDIIMSGGEKVSPLPIEEVIQQYPDVNSVAVVGIPDEKWQEAVTAVVVPQRGISISEKDVILYCKGKLASYEVPKKVHIMDELPLGPTGKVDRKTLKEMIYKVKVV